MRGFICGGLCTCHDHSNALIGGDIMKKYSKFLPILLCLSLFISLQLCIFAEWQRLTDNADLLTDTQEELLAEKLDILSESLEYDIIVATVEGLDGKSVERCADDFYYENGYGQGSERSGIMLFVSIADRDYMVYTHGEAVDIFSDYELDMLEYAFLEDLSAGNYYDSFSAFADEAAYYIEQDGKLSPVWILISLGAGVLIAFLVLRSMISKHKNIKMQRTADSYMLRDTFHLDRSRDIFLYSRVTRRLKPKNNSSSGGGSRSGGRSGGRSGKF